MQNMVIKYLITFFVLYSSTIGICQAALPRKVVAKITEANRLANARRDKEALKAIDEFLQLIKGKSFPGESSYVESLAVAARICNSSGDPRKGLILTSKALESAAKLKPANPHVTGMAYVSAASCHLSLGSPDEAQAQAEKAWEILGQVKYRGTIPNLIPRCHSMIRLAANYNGQGDSLMAEKYYRLAANDGRTLMGIEPQGASYDIGKFIAAGRAFSSLGGFYVQSGDYRRAIPLILVSEKIRRQAGPSSMPTQTSDIEASYIALSRAYLGLGDPIRARTNSFKAIQSAYQSSDQQRLMVAKSTLSSVHSFLGDFDESLAVTKEVQEIMRSIRNDPKHESPALINNIGWTYLLKGDLTKAKSFLTKAYQLHTKSIEPDANLTANILFSLSMVEFLQKNPDRGVLGLKKAHGMYEKEIDKMAVFGSDSQKLAYLQQLRSKTDFVLTMAFGKYRSHNELAHEAFLTTVRRKGRMTRLLQQSAQLLKQGEGNSTERKRLEAARSNLSLLALSLGIITREGAQEFDQDWMIELEEAERALQQKIGGKAGPSLKASALTFEQIKSGLNSGETLVEYVVYRPYQEGIPKAKAKSVSRRCGAFVVTAEGKLWATDLGPYREIKDLSIRFRQSLSRPGDPSYKTFAKALYQKLIEPLMEGVSSSKKLRIAPDGQLTQIPFGALINKQGEFLEDRMEITYIANGAEVLAGKNRVRNAGQLTIFAGPNYSLGLVRKASYSISKGFSPKLSKFWEQGSTVGTPLQFQPLPGTVSEAKAIAGLIPGATVIEGEKATEGSFIQTGGGGILHLATHGFYLNDELIASNEQRGLKRIKDSKPLGLENIEDETDQGNWTGRRSLDHPLLKCGLVFSGANQLFDGKNDGILTGMEILSLDLTGTDLVVLSACETGVGEVVTGEGALGINQAFRVAGASSLVTSLWKVNDQATAALMTKLYSELSSGTPKGEALRRASRSIRTTEKWSHPSYWAAFTLMGNAEALAK